MKSLWSLEVLMIGLTAFIIIIAALDYTIGMMYRDRQPRTCITPQGNPIPCPVEMGGTPPLPQQYIVPNYTVRCTGVTKLLAEGEVFGGHDYFAQLCFDPLEGCLP